jgi:hypothetical protein
VRTDRDGMRDVFAQELPNPGVVAVGDSFTFEHGVAAEETSPEQLQRALRVNVLNAGVFGYAIRHDPPRIAALERSGHAIRLVLYAMSWNDVPSGPDRPDAQTVRDGYLVADPRFEAPAAASLLTRVRGSRLFVQLTDRLAIGRVLFSGIKALFPALGAASVASFDGALPERTAQTRAFLLEWKRELDASGAKLAIVHIGDGNLIMPEAWQDYSRRHTHARSFARDELADWCRAHGIAFADAIDPLQEMYVASGRERSSVMLAVDNHYNREGYAVIARVFAELIGREGLFPSAWRVR